MLLIIRDNYNAVWAIEIKQKVFREHSGRIFKRAQTQLTSVLFCVCFFQFAPCPSFYSAHSGGQPSCNQHGQSLALKLLEKGEEAWFSSNSSSLHTPDYFLCVGGGEGGNKHICLNHYDQVSTNAA